MLRKQNIKVCPSCYRNIDDLYGRFVDPAQPVKDCPHCGSSVVKEKVNLQIRIVK